MKTISLFNNKGGVGKTTLTWNLSVSLSAKGKSVLLIDFDPQCNLSIALLGETGFSNLLKKDAANPYGRTIRAFCQPFIQQDIPPVVHTFTPLHPMEAGSGRLDIAPGDFWLNNLSDVISVGTDLIAGNAVTRFLIPSLIAQKAKEINDCEYDYVLIDVPPSFNTIVRSALYCSDYFIVPCTADIFSAYCIGLIGETLPKFRDDWEQGVKRSSAQSNALISQKGAPKFAGWVFNGFDKRKNKGQSASSEIAADAAHRDKIIESVKNDLRPKLSTIKNYQAVANFTLDTPIAKVEDLNVMAPDSILRGVPLRYLPTVKPTRKVLVRGAWSGPQVKLMKAMALEHDNLADYIIKNFI
ncbi:ParA family protein [Pantoea agglomerans]|uniref:ParA family protein n=1 Tax=Enterobacter agglomerans TaxID=549 RepID=UPI0010C22848|nr:ParA family protein [Pantoea agglomerans]TKJ56926.1 P-loop NTPase [Pantoea agglomerans]